MLEPSRFVRRFAAWLGLIVVAAWPRPAAAWWDDGHRIVGEIASRHLSEQARAQVEALLADLPEYASMATAATWADQQAKLDKTFDFAFTSHFVNVDRRLTPRELYALCLQKAGCVATGITYYADVLRSQRASKQQRAEALRFLIHFVGDAHQPLHAGHGPDRGGNDIDDLRLLEFTPGKERINLHAVWDGGMIGLHEARMAWDWQRYASELDARIDADKLARWQRGSVYDWLEESRLLAAADAYLHADGKTPVRKGDVLGDDYFAHGLPIVEMRLQQAGVRLALLLEEIY
jgi:hypothetical protein